ncbi:hypothetical protein M408DRAFT_143913 [Serendipita vermifera MAFF 305830]|uniref:Uncharacterized protein n=1 Tax=Serendipita vermifera MAFF 305830 TaxID=933852 RepID=A0A0C3B9Q9_SERVB|nr:hypothetical protein M408DRAFT_143913 [Serendipita vermifera MAFF 305830]
MKHDQRNFLCNVGVCKKLILPNTDLGISASFLFPRIILSPNRSNMHSRAFSDSFKALHALLDDPGIHYLSPL